MNHANRFRWIDTTVLLWLVMAIIPCRAADWTEFRGPTGQGHAGNLGLPIQWSESDHIAWKVAIDGHGWSSPVTSAGRIYLTTAIPEGEGNPPPHVMKVLCMDGADGKLIWASEVFRHPKEQKLEFHSKNSHASPTPVLDGDRLFVHFGPYGTACLKTDGTVVWKNDELKYDPQHGNGGSPALTEQLMIICCDGKDQQFVVGLDRQTGRIVWKTKRDTTPASGFSFCTPTIIQVNGALQAVCPGSQAVFAYNPETGAEIWRVVYGQGFSVVPRPVYGHGLVFICTGFGDGQLLAIDPTGTGDVTTSHVKWSAKKGVPKSPSLLLVDQHLYMVDDEGVATCLNALTGDSIWTHRLGGAFSASPLHAGGKIYFQSESGETTVIDAAAEYREVGKNQIGGESVRTFASFAVLNEDILLRSDSHLYRISK
jgi:outer membrane protein assembly factor BamB